MDPAPPNDPELDFGAPAAQDFQSTEQIGARVLACLAAGTTDAAATLIATSSAEVGDALLGLRGLTPTLLDGLAEAFYRARDFERAVVAAGRLEDPERAALFLERGGQFVRAAELRERLGQAAQAADLYLRGGAPERAAALFVKLGQLEPAADAFERAGRLYEAGRLWSRQRRLDRALAVLQRIDTSDDTFVPAMLLLGRILEFTGHPAAAIARYQEVVHSRPLDASTIDIHERLIGLFVQANNVADARRLISKVLKFEPTRPYPVRALGLLLGKGSTEATMRSVVSSPPPPPDAAESRIFSSQQPHTITAIHPAIDQLRQLPLFQELSLSEIREIHAAGEVARYRAGEVLVEQDQEGTFFFVLFSGAVQVSRSQGAGRGEVLLAELRYGACVGEMALLDEGPTSARVRALVDTATFRWPLAKMRALLAANERTALRILRVMSRAMSVRLRETSSHVHEGVGAVTIRLQVGALPARIVPRLPGLTALVCSVHSREHPHEDPTMNALLASSALALSLLFFGADASAATNPCGNIELTAISSCRFETSGGCKAKCTPLSLLASCDGQCNLSTEVTCTGSCQSDCEASCTADPPKFNCTATCTADCRARIAARCEGEADQAGCQSYCDGMCDMDCQSQCDAVAPQADCKAKCQGSCSGSCETDANFDCSYVKCSVDLQGGCDVACDTPDGALFCDGQYLAVSDIPACLEYLATNFKIDVKVSGSASASASSASCSMTDGPASSLGWLSAAFGTLTMLGSRRRRR